MKAVERYLYIRNGYYYFRSRLPQAVIATVGKQEVIIALGLKDYYEARLCVVKLECSLMNVCSNFSSQFNFECLIETVKRDSGIQTMRKPNIMGHALYSVIKKTGGESVSFSDLVTEYLKDCSHCTFQTLEKKKAVFEIFSEVIGDLQFNSLNKFHARQFKSFLIKMPSNIKKYQTIKSYSDINWKHAENLPRQSNRTINFKLSCMTALFNWAIRNDFYEQDNPFSGAVIKGVKTSKSSRKPFSNSQLKQLFSLDIFDEFKEYKSHYWCWIIIIALYSGMRMNEICQLEVTDIRQENNIWVFDVNDDGDKSLKNKSSIRVVPIHKIILELGFLEFVKQKKLKIFDEIPKKENYNYAYIFSKRFAHFLKKNYIKSPDICFHSFRHNFIDGLRQAGVERQIAMKLAGHQSGSTVHDSYGFGYSLETLSENINRLNYNIEI